MSSRKVLTLVMLRRKGEVLLGMKKRGFGEGRWNGFGGKVEVGESIVGGAVREVREECGLEVREQDLRQIGDMDFEFVGEQQVLEVHVFECWRFNGVEVETEEMAPQWFSEDEVPFTKMWPDDELWYPLMFRGQRFKANFLFEGHDKIVKQDIVLVN